jgi:hypothetical protein
MAAANSRSRQADCVRIRERWEEFPLPTNKLRTVGDRLRLLVCCFELAYDSGFVNSEAEILAQVKKPFEGGEARAWYS